MKKCAIFFLLIWCVIAQGEMVNRYSFNDGDTTAIDSIGGEDGILTESATISGNRLVLDGSSAVELPSDILDEGLETVTIEAWFQDDATGNNWSRLFDFGATSGGDGGNGMFCPAQQYGNIRFTVATNGLPSWQTGENTVSGPAHPGEETHVACVWDGSINEIRIYINGELAEAADTTMDITAIVRENAYIGDSSYPGDPYFTGSVDEFRIYNTALTDEEVLASFTAGPDVSLSSDMQAGSPKPKNKSSDILRDTVLIWTPGIYADTHTVYFGTDFNDVNNGTALVSEEQDANTYDPGILEFGQTYYWRVDEVNAPANPGEYTGAVWSFTVEPIALKIPSGSISVKASSQESEEEDPNNTINESGLDPNAMDLHSDDSTGMWSTDDANATDPAWIQYDFDKVYKLHQMLVWNYNGQSILAGFGIKDVNIQYSEDSQNWTQLTSTTQFAKATGKPGYKYNTTVEFNGVSAKSVRINAINNWGGSWYPQYGLSEVRFLYIPIRAREPYPNDVNDVAIDVTLSWRAGREAVEHTVLYSTDEQAVIDGTAASETIAQTSYGPLSLVLGSVYYWQVNEVGDSDTWPGDIWSFKTQDYTVVEDFEFYDDEEPNRVWDYWADGWDDTSNGSTMGYPDPDFDNDEHFVETQNVYGGKQAAPIYYNNSGTTTYSEVSIDAADLPIGTNWSAGSPETLVMWFFGDVNNTADLMYVKLNNKKVYYHGDPIHLTQSVWRPCIIDISEFGVSLGNITSLAIGFERASGPGVESMVLIDDITLYRVAPEIPEAVEPSTEGLVAYYAMENNVRDSSGNNRHGTVLGAPTYVDSITGYGKAMEFSADSNDCIDLGDDDAFDPAGSFSISVWAYIKNWSTNWGDVMVSNRGEDNVGWQLRRHNSNSICFTTRGVGSDDMASEIDAPLFEWVQIVCVYDNDANTKRLYIDGILDSEVDTDEGETIAAATQNVYIGARALSSNNGVDSYFTGILDEVRIYNRALSYGEAVFLADPTP